MLSTRAVSVCGSRSLRTHLSAAAHGELLEGADVIDEQVHEAELVGEAHQDEEAGRVQGHAV